MSDLGKQVEKDLEHDPQLRQDAREQSEKRGPGRRTGPRKGVVRNAENHVSGGRRHRFHPRIAKRSGPVPAAGVQGPRDHPPPRGPRQGRTAQRHRQGPSGGGCAEGGLVRGHEPATAPSLRRTRHPSPTPTLRTCSSAPPRRGRKRSSTTSSHRACPPPTWNRRKKSCVKPGRCASRPPATRRDQPKTADRTLDPSSPWQRKRWHC